MSFIIPCINVFVQQWTLLLFHHEQPHRNLWAFLSLFTGCELSLSLMSFSVGTLLSWWIFMYCRKVQAKILAGFLNRRKRYQETFHYFFKLKCRWFTMFQVYNKWFSCTHTYSYILFRFFSIVDYYLILNTVSSLCYWYWI